MTATVLLETANTCTIAADTMAVRLLRYDILNGMPHLKYGIWG